jgi:hypothetical protein
MRAESFQLCTKRDDFIWDKAVWVVTLSDGTEVWQDDGREGAYEPNAWIRLGRYCAETGLTIKTMNLKFRSHVIAIPKSPFFYFTKGIVGSTGSPINLHFANAGYLNDEGKLEVTWYKIPELLPARVVIKTFDELEGLEVIKGMSDDHSNQTHR